MTALAVHLKGCIQPVGHSFIRLEFYRRRQGRILLGMRAVREVENGRIGHGMDDSSVWRHSNDLLDHGQNRNALFFQRNPFESSLPKKVKPSSLAPTLTIEIQIHTNPTTETTILHNNLMPVDKLHLQAAELNGAIQ